MLAIKFQANPGQYSSILQSLHSPVNCGWQLGVFDLRPSFLGGSINAQYG